MSRYLLTTTVAFFLSLAMAGNIKADILYNFEEGSIPTGGWGTEKEIVTNPHPCGNVSDHCLKMVITNYGGVSFPCGAEIGTKLLAVDVFTLSDCTIKAYSNESDENQYQPAKGGVWSTLYFDFTKHHNASDEILIALGGESGTIYIDNIRFTSDQSDAVQCTEKKLDEKCAVTIPYTYGTLAIGGGGFVSGIIASGSSKYARTDVGGAYKWNAGDCSWQPITNFISEEDKGLLSIEALAIDPQNEKNIYLLGGCQYFSNQKTAIMYSKDGGKTFETADVTSLIFAHGNGQGRNCGERIAVDPNNSDIILCGGRANNPLIKSEDGGKTWKAVSSLNDVYTKSVKWPSWGSNSYPTTPDENGTTAIVFDGSSVKNGKTQRIFVGISRTGASNLYVSEDGGSTWSDIAALPTQYIPCRMKMDGNGKLLIAYSNACVSGTAGAVFRYDPQAKKAEDISPSKNYGLGDVAVSPTDPNKLVVSTNNTWIPQQWDNGASANGDIYWTSTDGGKTWRSLQNNMKLTNNNVTWIPGYAIHWSGSLCFDPKDDNIISTTSGNGIFTCEHIWCEGTPTFHFDVNGLEETVALDLVSVPNGDLMSVIGDYTGFIHDDIHQFAPIHDPAPGTTGGINYYSKDPKVMMRVANAGFYYTTSGHKGWKECAKTDFSYQNPYCNTCAPQASNEGKCAITKRNGTYRFFIIPGPGTSGIYYSDNNGSSWTKISGTDAATHIQVDPENDAYVYAGGKNAFYRSTDYGDSFDKASLNNNEYGRIAIIPGKEGQLYAPGGNNGLYFSNNYGEDFSKVANVTNCEAVGTGIGKGSDYALYIWGNVNDCGMGLYLSEDYGKSWSRINDDQHQFGGPGNGQFVVGDWNTYGRFYMSTVGLGIVYGERSENATPSQWNCYVDNTDCKVDYTWVEETKQSDNIAYPNPFNVTVTIKGNGQYHVTNALGQTVEHGTLSDEKEIGADWLPGLYIIQTDYGYSKVVKANQE